MPSGASVEIGIHHALVGDQDNDVIVASVTLDGLDDLLVHGSTTAVRTVDHDERRTGARDFHHPIEVAHTLLD